jgi:hypothetical protein
MIKRGLRPATLGAVVQQIQRLGEKTLLIADYVTPQLADTLRNHGIAFIDTAGNAYINNPPILIWIKGERPITRVTHQPTGRAFQTSGLQVIFALLCNPELADRPYREIARLADVGVVKMRVACEKGFRIREHTSEMMDERRWSPPG